VASPAQVKNEFTPWCFIPEVVSNIDVWQDFTSSYKDVEAKAAQKLCQNGCILLETITESFLWSMLKPDFGRTLKEPLRCF
jgi:predicted small integral membrane protein